MRLAEQLRDALPGAAVVLNLGGGNFKTQFRRADRSGARLALILGDEELDRGVAAVKPLRREGGQIDCPLAELPGRIASTAIDGGEGVGGRVSERKRAMGAAVARLREQAPWMLAGVAVVAAAFGGWRLWQSHGPRPRARGRGSRYQQAADGLHAQRSGWRREDRRRVVKDFGGSAYSDQANLAAARVQAENQQLDQAAARLREVMQHTRDDPRWR